MASICVLGGIETVTLRMEVLSTSTASTLPLTPPDFVFVDEGLELRVEPGGTSCFRLRIEEDDLDEDVEEILVLVTQGNDTNGTFALAGVIKIVDNDFSEAYISLLYS